MFVRRSACSRCSRDDAVARVIGSPSCDHDAADAQKPSAMHHPAEKRRLLRDVCAEFGEKAGRVFTACKASLQASTSKAALAA